MRVGIDASNLREGGGRTHLIELLRHAEPHLGPWREVVVWGGRETLDQLPARPWLHPVHERALDGRLAGRTAWQVLTLPRRARGVDLLFSPGGVAPIGPRPRIVMSRNMLPFEPAERDRYGRGLMRARLIVLRQVQAASFASADGVIFLTDYARRTVCQAMRRAPRHIAVIPHGVGDQFRMSPRPQRVPTEAQPLRLLYVSALSPYKHQLELIEAWARARQAVPLSLTLIGPEDGTDYAARLRDVIARADPPGRHVRLLGKVSFDDIHRHYRDHDAFVFPSSCENMPNILVEAMSSGLPIACARRGPMPELLGEEGCYFDPDRPDDIARAILELARSATHRYELAIESARRADALSWDRCARETFAFLTTVKAIAR